MEINETRTGSNSNFTSESVVMKNKLRNAKKEGVTKGALITGIIGLLILIGLGIFGYSRYQRDHNTQVALLESQKLQFTDQLTQRDSMINDWLITFDEIEKNLNAIKQRENILNVKASEGELSKTKKDQVLEDIRYINSLIEENNKKIARLNAQLKKSGTTITGLQTRIAELEASMRQYESEITQLKSILVTKDSEIEQLNTRVYALKDTLNMKDETISQQTSELNKAFLATGTFRDLKAKGLLLKEGGFLGIGRKESLAADFPDSLFKTIDVTRTKTIPVNSKNARLITEHPTGSYEMIRENEKSIAYIEIKNPGEFWKISKYAVVEIIK